MYQKKIAYIDYMEDGVRIRNAGHVKTFLRDREYMIDMQIKGLHPTDSMLAELYLKGAEKAVGRLCINQGSCYYNARFQPWDVDGEGTKAEEIRGIVIPLSKGRSLQAEWQTESVCQAADITGSQTGERKKESVSLPESEPERQPESESEKQPTAEELPAPLPTVEAEKSISKPAKPAAEEKKLYADKWEQLQHSYQTVHPFGSGKGKYINIAPKDFVILREEYQQLVHNSFLLHGFYNYGHLILGKKPEQNAEYYLGVPGTYYEREKMVAVMFGFEGFERTGNASEDGETEAGTFGYYLRKVEI